MHPYAEIVCTMMCTTANKKCDFNPICGHPILWNKQRLDCAKRHFRSCVTEIDRVCLFLSCFLVVRRINIAFRPRKYRLAPHIWDLGILDKIKIVHPIIHSLIEVYVVEKSIVDKHGDATARHRTRARFFFSYRFFGRYRSLKSYFLVYVSLGG